MYIYLYIIYIYNIYIIYIYIIYIQYIYNIYMHIYAILKTICPLGYHHNGFLATQALGHMIFEHSVFRGSLMTTYDWLSTWLAPWCSVSVVDFEHVNAGWVLLILVILFTNNIFDWFIYFVVILCSIGLFFSVNITNFNNYLIYIMKLQVLLILWSLLKFPLFLGSRFVATSQFIWIAGWLAGFCMAGVFCWGDIRTDSTFLCF